MALSLENPYATGGKIWLKGNLHAHTNQSDGQRSPQEVVDDYASRGYDFLMISDHDKLTSPETVTAQGLTLIPGNEISAKGPHLLHVNAKSLIGPDENRQNVLNRIVEEKSFAIINHPNWQDHFNHCSQEKLNAWTNYAGIEIYNGVIRRLTGSPLATDRWDQLLSSGRRMWGYANDDSHAAEDVELAWNVVLAKDRSVAAICEALQTGSFYASTGVSIEHIGVNGRTINVRAPDASRIVVNCNFGKRIAQVDNSQITFHLPTDVGYSYVRVECYGKGEAMAWTQPFFIKR